MKSLGQIAYEAYFEQSKGKSLISGAPLPEFAAQREEVKAAWEAAAQAVIAASQEPEVIKRPSRKIE